jgi:hypothetical protein
MTVLGIPPAFPAVAAAATHDRAKMDVGSPKRSCAKLLNTARSDAKPVPLC